MMTKYYIVHVRVDGVYDVIEAARVAIGHGADVIDFGKETGKINMPAALPFLWWIYLNQFVKCVMIKTKNKTKRNETEV